MTLCCKPSMGTRGWEKEVVNVKDGGGVGVYQCVFFTISPWCLVVRAHKTLRQTLHHCPLPLLIRSCKKSKDELLSYVWCRHTGDYVLMFLIPVLLFFLLSSRMNNEQGWLWRYGEYSPPGASVIPRVRYQNTPMWAETCGCSVLLGWTRPPPLPVVLFVPGLINGATLSFPVKQPGQADSGLLCVLKRQKSQSMVSALGKQTNLYALSVERAPGWVSCLYFRGV